MKRKIFLISGSVLLLALALIIVLVFAKPDNTQASNPCKKQFYTNNDIVGYFRDTEKDNSYYITSDWCVVKAILWWGSVFDHPTSVETTVKTRIDKIFPEAQVYFGLLPEYLLKGNKDGGPRKGTFCTVGLKASGYLTNDDPFKNIYGNNYPQPPKFVDDTKICDDTNKSNQIAKPPSGSTAALIMQRMHDLHYTIFGPRVSKGDCMNATRNSDLTLACQYFSNRTQLSIPPPYKAFTKKTGEI